LGKSLKRISLSTNNILLDNHFNIVPEMLGLLKAIKNKYRIYLITLVDQEDPQAGNHLKARQ